jgi:hypothetical protein
MIRTIVNASGMIRFSIFDLLELGPIYLIITLGHSFLCFVLLANFIIDNMVKCKCKRKIEGYRHIDERRASEFIL